VFAIDQSLKTFEQANAQLKFKSGSQENHLLAFFTKEIQRFQEHLPIINALGNEDLRERHWKQICGALGVKSAYKLLSYNDYVHYGIASLKEQVEQISQKASGEAMVETQLRNIQQKWDELSFVVVPYNEQKGGFRITGVDEILLALDDNLSTLQTI